MDQIAIGNFIKALRKEKSLTQRELAEMLNISEKTVSKWETGSGLPEVSLMLPLCELLEISVNELLSGERLDANRYQEKAEENIVSIFSDKTVPKKTEEDKMKKILYILGSIEVLLGFLMLFARAVIIATLPTYGELSAVIWISVALIILGVFQLIYVIGKWDIW